MDHLLRPAVINISYCVCTHVQIVVAGHVLAGQHVHAQQWAAAVQYGEGPALGARRRALHRLVRCLVDLLRGDLLAQLAFLTI